MIEFIRKQGKTNVTNLYQNLRLNQSVASQQLAILREFNILQAERDGKRMYYSVNEDRISHIEKLSGDIISL